MAKELDKEKVARELEAGIKRFNKLLANVKEAGLHVRIGAFPSAIRNAPIKEGSELFISGNIYETISY